MQYRNLGRTGIKVSVVGLGDTSSILIRVSLALGITRTWQ